MSNTLDDYAADQTDRCKHEKRWTICEEGTSFSQHSFNSGEISHYNDLDRLTGMATFKCNDCGMAIRFNTSRTKIKWLRDRMEIATTYRPEE